MQLAYALRQSNCRCRHIGPHLPGSPSLSVSCPSALCPPSETLPGWPYICAHAHMICVPLLRTSSGPLPYPQPWASWFPGTAAAAAGFAFTVFTSAFVLLAYYMAN